MEFDYKKYTAKNETFSFKVNDLEFTCEEMNIGEEAEFFNYYIESDGRHNIAKLRLVQATKLIKTPFKEEWLKYVFDTFYPEFKIKEYNWESFDLKTRLMFLSKLESDFISNILNEITNYYLKKSTEIKNL